MKQRMLGDLAVSTVGLGCMGLSHAYGVAMPKPEGIRLIGEAVEMGYTFFDTAELYIGKYADGTPAVNEELVGEALRPYRNQVVIATKGGVQWDDDPHHAVPCGTPESMRKSLEGSLKRMGLETIDLYYLHKENPNMEPEVIADLMQTFIKEGKIRHWGLSNTSPDYIRRANAVCKLTAVQERYSMMARWNESMFPLLEELDIGFVAYSPLANGFLTNRHTGSEQFDKNLDFRSAMPQYTEEGIVKSRKLVDLIDRLAQEKEATPAQISLAWMLCKKPWIVPIPGSKKAARIQENADAVSIILQQEEIKEIDDLLDTVDFDVFGKSNLLLHNDGAADFDTKPYLCPGTAEPY